MNCSARISSGLGNLPSASVPFPDEWRRYDYAAIAEAAARISSSLIALMFDMNIHV